MGNVTTNVGKEVISDVNAIINNIVANTISSSRGGVTKNNTNEVQVGGTTTQGASCGGGIPSPTDTVTILKNDQVQYKLSEQSTANAVSKVKASLPSEIQTYVNTTTSEKRQWLTVALGANPTTENSVQTIVANVIANIDVDVGTTCRGFVYTDATTPILYCAPSTQPITIDQTNDITIAFSCSSKLVFAAIANNSDLNSNIQQAERQGSFSFLDGLIYFFLAIVVIIVIATVFMAFHRSRNAPPPQPLPYSQ